MTQTKQVVLVTGAGSGIGRAIAVELARAGHHVYASMRDVRGEDAARAQAILALAQAEDLALKPLDLNVLSDVSCHAAVASILAEADRIDVVVNNAGMLMQGVTEACSVAQVTEILDTNVLSWLRVNQAVLPVMRRQGHGLLMYVSSTTARLHEPFMGPYIASKAAGDALAEIQGMEVKSFGIETVILVPGAFTAGTEHFAHARQPAHRDVDAQYRDVMARAAGLRERIDAIDLAAGGLLEVSAVGKAACVVLATPRGQRPSRVTIDAQQKGTEAVDALYHLTQTRFLARLGLGDLAPTAPAPAVTDS